MRAIFCGKHQISFDIWGDQSLQRPVIYFHGYPGSRLEGSLLDKPAKKRGLSIIAFDRPGYGYSTNNPKLTLTSCGEIISTLSQELGLSGFSIVAVSGGAPFALGAAYELKERVRSLTIVSGLGMLIDPKGKLHNEVLQGMVMTNKILLFFGRNIPFIADVMSAGIAVWWKLLPRHMLGYLKQILPKPDVELFASESFANFAIENVTESLRQGGAHASRDLRLYTSPWSFEPSELSCRTHFWHGEADTYVPGGSAKNLANAIPQATIRIVPDQGHFMFFNHLPEILNEVI